MTAQVDPKSRWLGIGLITIISSYPIDLKRLIKE
nr:MAG TPA_asm: hypothetical protein [Caudoviricetes sp.]